MPVADRLPTTLEAGAGSLRLHLFYAHVHNSDIQAQLIILLFWIK